MIDGDSGTDVTLPTGIPQGADAQGDTKMMMAVAFLMFALLIAGWLLAPERGREELPEVAKTPAMSPETLPSKA